MKRSEKHYVVNFDLYWRMKMKYKQLAALYYKSKTEYENVYNNRLAKDECVLLDFDINGNQAFFLETPDLLKKVISIERKKTKVEMLKNMLPGVALKQFTNKSLIDEIVITNNIEGVNSTRREIEDILDDLASKSKRNRFLGLVKKYIALEDTKNRLSVSTCQDIRDIYDEIFLDEVRLEDPEDLPDGEVFRAGPVSVTSSSMKDIHHGLMPESKIIEGMNKALYILNNPDIEMVFRIGIFHYLFGYIHPFYEANGRMSRFLSSYLLSQSLEPLLGYRISYTVKEHLSDYYRAFKDCNDTKNRGDLTPFVIMFTEIIEIAIEQLVRALEERYEQLIKYVMILQHFVDVNSEKMWLLYDYLLQAALFSESGIPIKALLSLLEISRATLSKRLALIDESGFLMVKQRGKEKYYQLNLEALDEWAAKHE